MLYEETGERIWGRGNYNVLYKDKELERTETEEPSASYHSRDMGPTSDMTMPWFIAQ